jgi:maltose alpha-D-glucosyltransferase/alpha-amylase
MIRSYSNAAYAALFAFGVHAPEDYAALAPWASTWEHWTADAFLKGYLGAADVMPLLPRDAKAGVTLVSAFTLDKALRDLGYELHNRPDWVSIPVAGILRMLEDRS